MVIAFGGNALLPDPFQPEEQEERAAGLAEALALLAPRDAGLVLVHGNGPQVGMILLRVEATRHELPAEPLDVLVAETQGSVGLLLCRALSSAFAHRKRRWGVSAVLTQVVVDGEDPKLLRPDKPVGPFYDAERAARLRDEQGWELVEQVGRGWRRVVASPAPLEVVEVEAIRHAARPGQIVVAGGGGGVPVLREADGSLRPIEGVVDKDRTACLMARQLDAGSFVILTGVPCVVRGFGGPHPEPLHQLDRARARALLEAGEFPPGSMGPKIEAALDYVEATGRAALITDTESLSDALQGRTGTWIRP